MSKMIVQVKLNLNKLLIIWIKTLNISRLHLCVRFSCAENCVCSGILRNGKLLTNCSWNWKGSKPKMLFIEHKQQREGVLWISFWKLMQRSGFIQVCRTKTLSITRSSMLLTNQKSCITGSKKAILTKVCRNFKASPKETGPQRKLSVKEELT